MNIFGSLGNLLGDIQPGLQQALEYRRSKKEQERKDTLTKAELDQMAFDRNMNTERNNREAAVHQITLENETESDIKDLAVSLGASGDQKALTDYVESIRANPKYNPAEQSKYALMASGYGNKAYKAWEEGGARQDYQIIQDAIKNGSLTPKQVDSFSKKYEMFAPWVEGALQASEQSKKIFQSELARNEAVTGNIKTENDIKKGDLGLKLLTAFIQEDPISGVRSLNLEEYGKALDAQLFTSDQKARAIDVAKGVVSSTAKEGLFGSLFPGFKPTGEQNYQKRLEDYKTESEINKKQNTPMPSYGYGFNPNKSTGTEPDNIKQILGKYYNGYKATGKESYWLQNLIERAKEGNQKIEQERLLRESMIRGDTPRDDYKFGAGDFHKFKNSLNLNDPLVKLLDNIRPELKAILERQKMQRSNPFGLKIPEDTLGNEINILDLIEPRR